MLKKGFATLAFSLVLASSPTFAQEEDYTRFRSEVTAQAVGSFVKTTTQSDISQGADNTAGVLGGYRFYFDRHNGVELNYGYTQNTEKYGTTGIETNSHEVSAAYVFRFPMKHWAPFVLAGAGGMIFDPRNFAGADNQARPAFLYGGGADFNLSDHLFVRAEYGATKAALRSFVRTWTTEFAGKGIRANIISPGPTETPILEGQFGANAEMMKERFKTMIPMGRMGRPEDIASAPVFLASDESSYITGIDLPVDGGLVAV